MISNSLKIRCNAEHKPKQTEYRLKPTINRLIVFLPLFFSNIQGL